MPPASLLKDLTKCKHPKSRRTKALAKKAKKFNNRDKIKISHAVRSNALGERFTWFQERIGEERTEPLSGVEFNELIVAYLRRFDDELEQINLKQSISKGRAHQHHSRMNAINITVEKETNEYNGGGWDFIDLCDSAKFKTFMAWDGNTLNLQNFKLERLSKKKLAPSMEMN